MARTPKNASTASAPAVDLADLAGKVTEDTMTTPGSKRWIGNPFVALLRESFLQDDAGENGVKSTPEVQAAQVKRQVLPALRNAAEQLANDDIGIRIKFYYVNDAGEVVETGNLGKFVKETHEDARAVRVKFLGRPKKVYLSDEQKAEAISRKFLQTDREGTPFEPPRIDTAAYLQWVSAGRPENDDEDDADNGDLDDTDDDQDAEDVA